MRILHYIFRYKISGKLNVELDVKKKSYASMLCISITDYDSEIPAEEGKKMLRYINDYNYIQENEDSDLIAVRLLRLLFEQISAETDIYRDEKNTVHINIAIPHLAI